MAEALYLFNESFDRAPISYLCGTGLISECMSGMSNFLSILIGLLEFGCLWFTIPMISLVNLNMVSEWVCTLFSQFYTFW